MGSRNVEVTATRRVRTCDVCDRELGEGSAQCCAVCGREVGYCCGILFPCYDTQTGGGGRYFDLCMRLCKRCESLTDGDDGPKYLDLIRGHVKTAEAFIRAQVRTWKTKAKGSAE